MAFAPRARSCATRAHFDPHPPPHRCPLPRPQFRELLAALPGGPPPGATPQLCLRAERLSTLLGTSSHWAAKPAEPAATDEVSSGSPSTDLARSFSRLALQSRDERGATDERKQSGGSVGVVQCTFTGLGGGGHVVNMWHVGVDTHRSGSDVLLLRPVCRHVRARCSRRRHECPRCTAAVGRVPQPSRGRLLLGPRWLE